MTIGIVLPATPNYSETFFVNKIKGLQSHGFSVKLFVSSITSNFSLCTVYKRPPVSKNKFFFVLRAVWVFICLLPHLKKTIRLYKLHINAGDSQSEALKSIYLNAHLLKEKLDWVHFGFATQGIGSELVAKAIGAKMAVSFRGYDINIYPKKHPDCYFKLWKNVDKIHSISQYLVDEAHHIGLHIGIPVSVITPAVNQKLIYEVKNMHNSRNNNLTICTVGRLNWIKDFSTAIETISLLKKTFPTIRYEIIGGGNKKEIERYKYHVYSLGLKENVIFSNRLTHLETLQKVNLCDIYLQTSLNEGFCNAVLEAQALGKLCVVSNVGGLKENIIHNKTGWLVQKQDSVMFANKIEEVLRLSDREKNNISDNASSRVIESFKMINQIHRFIDFYENGNKYSSNFLKF